MTTTPPEAGSDASDGSDQSGQLGPLNDGIWRMIIFGLGSAALFGLGLLVTEQVGEIAVDVDLKPFFIPYLLIAVVNWGLLTLSISFGAAVGEGILDIFEGYELDDPIGFLGYVIGFLVFGWLLKQAQIESNRNMRLTLAAVTGAFVQAIFEGLAFFIFDPTAGIIDAIVSILGNTITHGILLGAIPLVLLYSPVRRRILSNSK